MKDSNFWAGKTALVTGGTSGLGRPWRWTRRAAEPRLPLLPATCRNQSQMEFRLFKATLRTSGKSTGFMLRPSAASAPSTFCSTTPAR